MRPNATEMLRGLQTILMSDIAPEVKSPFGQDVLQIAQMLIETVVSEIDGAAEYLARDNQMLADLLARGAAALGDLDPALAGELHAGPTEKGSDSLTLSALSERNQRLRGLLERLLQQAEDRAGSLPPDHPLMGTRSDTYRHLREVAARGWSFWDVFSFRERMARLRSQGA